jgi:hypothetical protein
MLRRTGLLCIALLLICGCGKRGPPPSPDRWAPKLAGANPVDRNHLDLVFSEEMDKNAAGGIDSYTVVDDEGETLRVYAAYLLPNGQAVRLTTETQESVKYSVFVSGVTDDAGNELRPGSAKSFRGSSDRDTTRPHVRTIYPSDGAISVPLDSTVQVVFSETMDTSSVSLAVGALIVLPAPTDSALVWNEEMSSISMPILAFTSHKASIYVTGGCRDYGGNRLLRSERSIFTTEDSMPAGMIQGTVSADAGIVPLFTPVGVFDSLWAPLLLDYARDTTGSFTFMHLKDGEYRIAAGADRDRDGYLDVRGFSDELTVRDGGRLEAVKVDLGSEGALHPAAEAALANFYIMNLDRDGVD